MRMKQNNNKFNKNLLICGDNLQALDDLIKQNIKVDLIYLDPPFFSNRHYEVVWGDEAEVRSFKDRWAGGIHVYIEWMRERIVKMYDILKDTGSFYLHCDWHASHYLKVMLDEVFSHKNFRNEIVWYYEIGGRVSQKSFGRRHDIIFFYTKNTDYTFNWDKILREWTEAGAAKFKYSDEKGRYRLMGRFLSGSPIKGHRDISPEWERTHPNLVYRHYMKPGRMCLDVWDIPPINQASKERLGYPTQKPESLLDRIIIASSNESDLLLDPFCGCGTAMVVANRLKRKWIGIDISPTAINLIEKRLEKLGAIKGKNFDSIGMPTTMKALKKLEPFEFQNWVINEMKARQSKKKTGDMGIDGHYEKTIFTERAGIQVKQSEKVGRNVVFNFETALRAGKFEKGYIVAFSYTSGTYEEAVRAKEDGLEIHLIIVEDLLLGKVKI